MSDAIHVSDTDPSETAEKDLEVALTGNSVGMGVNEEEEEERKAFHRVVQAYRFYTRYNLSANNRRRKHFLALPETQRALAPEHAYRLKAVDQVIQANGDILGTLVRDLNIFENAHHGEAEEAGARPTDSEMSKVTSVLKSLVRDWSDDGADERNTSYGPLLRALEEHRNSKQNQTTQRLRVLIPGCGLGRLAWDVAKAGHIAEGNEFSYFMLLTSNFVFNQTGKKNQFAIFPSVHSFSNMLSHDDILHGVYFPDVLPSHLPADSDLSMSAGDFLDIYQDKQSKFATYDAVLTCFFLDTAKNIIDYIQTLAQILKPGALWANVGPLLYHWENNPAEVSIELTLEEVKSIVNKYFHLIEERMIETTYTRTPRGSMLRYTYTCAYWKALRR